MPSVLPVALLGASGGECKPFGRRGMAEESEATRALAVPGAGCHGLLCVIPLAPGHRVRREHAQAHSQRAISGYARCPVPVARSHRLTPRQFGARLTLMDRRISGDLKDRELCGDLLELFQRRPAIHW